MDKAKKRIFTIIGVLLLIALTVVVCYFLFYKKPAPDDLLFDDNATTGVMPGVDIDERRKELQDLLDKSLIAFSINTSPVFLNGTTEGNLLIENPGNNAKLLQVSILCLKIFKTRHLYRKCKAAESTGKRNLRSHCLFLRIR